MKKLFLLLVGGVATMSAYAQVNDNMMLNPKQTKAQGHGLSLNKPHEANIHALTTANKTATTTVEGWWSYNDANDPGNFVQYDGTTNTGNYGEVPVYTDSNIYVSSGAFYWWCHGLGVSFDPNSLYFTSLFQPAAPAVPPGPLDPTKGYYIDSIYTIGSYLPFDTTLTDTLYLELTYANDTTAWDVTYASSLLITYGVTAAPDTTYTLAEPLYAPASNSLDATTPHRVRITKLLNAATTRDTTAGGWNAWAFPTGGLFVPKGKHLIAYTHFEPQLTAPFGKSIDSVNIWYQQSWHLTDPMQSLDSDFNSGLVSSSDERYGNGYTFMSHPILAPSYLYSAPIDVHNPYFQFYLRQVTTGVNNVADNIKSVDAYPNPAKGILSISFNMATAADVTVTLTNILGEQVCQQIVANATTSRAIFDVTSFAEGIYIYTVSANGQQTTGRVVVAH